MMRAKVSIPLVLLLAAVLGFVYLAWPENVEKSGTWAEKGA